MCSIESLSLKELKYVGRELKLEKYSSMNREQLIDSISSSCKIKKKFYEGDSRLFINKFFDRIFIINLWDKKDRFSKVSRVFKRNGVKYERYEAVDGRKNELTDEEKRKELEKKYDIKIKKSIKSTVASLVIGTLDILEMQIMNKWEHILICEDDVVFKNIDEKFRSGVSDLPKRWDLLYLGCGGRCGTVGISEEKTRENKHRTSLSIPYPEDSNWYVKHKDDLRTPCDDCKKVKGSDILSYASAPGGGWAYAVSLSGAKKLKKYIGGRITDHIDQLLISAVKEKKIKAIAFDPPIIYHEGGSLRPDTTIEWEW